MKYPVRLLVAFTICATSFVPFAVGADSGNVGLVKEKPAEGRCVKTDCGYMVPYKVTIPGSDATFTMMPIPGGTYTLGSPATEKGRKADEGPQATISVEPFWMGQHEVTWAEYKQFMATYQAFKDFERLQLMLMEPRPPKLEGKTAEQIAALKQRLALAAAARKKLKTLLDRKEFAKLKARLSAKDTSVDGVTTPTPLYEPSYTFEHGGKPQQPAVTMTPFAARQYTKWLSGFTGQTYRLPAETEWEYACRAGSKTAFHFGDDASKLGDYAWYVKNADETPHEVGQKKPNAWGLYDMHGNVAEWVMDEYKKDAYKQLVDKNPNAVNTIVWPTTAYPRVLRGGSWDDTASICRSAARNGTHDDEDWKGEDPNLPLSPWWLTDDPARGVGFRIVRSLAKPDDKFLANSWNALVEDVQADVTDRIDEGRGAIGSSDVDLPEAIRQLNAAKKSGL